MPRPSKRTRSRKRVSITLPGGRRGLAYKREHAALSHCGICGQPLAGFSRLCAMKPRKLSRSERRVWRPQGGQLCHGCLRKHLKLTIRGF